MTKDWTFDQPLDDNTPTSSTEERAKIAALFHKEEKEETGEVNYVAAFEMEQQKAKEKSVSQPKVQEQSTPKEVSSSTITSDYKQHLANVMAQNNEDILQSQKKIEELNQLIDDKNKQNKKLQAISEVIDDL
ncbi:glutamate-cysteine ligase [Streptococcus pneumoniae]|nr:glutamate-cysteine ligase [Streptococcus pneumoniae]